jgi:hypothetical protein
MLLLMKLRFHVGPTHQKQFFLGYQTLINVAAGEPRPQPRSQTATKANVRISYGLLLLEALSTYKVKIIVKKLKN